MKMGRHKSRKKGEEGRKEADEKETRVGKEGKKRGGRRMERN